MTDRGYCPECLSKRLVKVGHVWSGRERKQQYRCQDCGRLTIKPATRENSRELVPSAA